MADQQARSRGGAGQEGTAADLRGGDAGIKRFTALAAEEAAHLAGYADPGNVSRPVRATSDGPRAGRAGRGGTGRYLMAP